MEFEDVIKKRRMVRRFLKKEVPEEKIIKILNFGRKAPSAGFLQPAEFIVVKRKETKKKLAKAALNQKWIYEAPLVIIVVTNTLRSAIRYGERGEKFYSIIDAAFAAENILLGIVNEGLSASFVGAFYDDEVSKILKLPDHVRAIGIIAIGYGNEKPESLKKYRRSFEEQVFSEYYGNPYKLKS